MRYPKQAKDVAWRSLGDFAVVIELGEKRNFHELNDTAAHIWSLCDGKLSESDIAWNVAVEFDVGPDQAGSEVREFIDTLLGLKLVTCASSSS
jgi:hypothetical protein